MFFVECDAHGISGVTGVWTLTKFPKVVNRSNVSDHASIDYEMQ